MPVLFAIQNEEAKAVWEKVLTCAILQSTLGTKEAAVKAVLGDVLRSVVGHLLHASWLLRLQALSVLRDMLSFLPGGLIAPNTAEVVTALLRTLPGQMWRGKEDSLRVLALLLEKCPHCLDGEVEAENLLTVFPVATPPSSTQGAATAGLPPAEKDTLLIVSLSDMVSRAGLADKISARLTVYAHEHQHPPETPPFPKCSGWRLSYLGIVSLFLQEAMRSDRQYRLAAASALSVLPWGAMQTPTAVQSILPLVPRLLQCAGLPESVTGIANAPDDDCGEKNSAEKGEGSVEDSANYKQGRRSNYDMFGGRYGGDPTAAKTKKGVKRARISRANADAMGASVTAAHVEEADVGRDMEGDDITERASTEDTGVVESSIEDGAEAAATTSLASYQSAGTDAAFRVKFLEAATALWPSHTTYLALCTHGETGGTQTETSMISGVQRIPEATVDWALLVVRYEVWSVRKAVLLLLRAMITAGWPLSRSRQAAVLEILSLSLDDTKYSQVRAAAASTLLRLIAGGGEESNVYKDVLTSDAIMINGMVSRMSLDTNPSVISSYASIQKQWASRGQP